MTIVALHCLSRMTYGAAPGRVLMAHFRNNRTSPTCIRGTTVSETYRLRSKAIGVATALASILSLSLTGTAAATARADEPSRSLPTPTAHYTMNHDGAKLLDESGNHHDGTLVNLSSSSFVDGASSHLLRFKHDGYVKLPKGLVTDQKNDNAFTVEMTVQTTTHANQFSWVIGDGFGDWDTEQLGNYVFVNPASASGENDYNGGILSGIRVYDKKTKANGEMRIPSAGQLSEDGTFSTVTMTSKDNRLTVYVNGIEKSHLDHPYSLKDIIPTGDVCGYLGKSLYKSDPLFTGTMSDVKFYDQALTADQVRSSEPTEAQRRAEDQQLKDADRPIPPTVLTDDQKATQDLSDAVASVPSMAEGNLPLLAKGANGSTITWKSSDPAIITDSSAAYRRATVGAANPYRGAGVVTRPAYGDGNSAPVTLTATVRSGNVTKSGTARVIVKEKPRQAPNAGYASVTFLSDADTTNGKIGEALYESATSTARDDFFSFKQINDENPVITSTADTTGLRDPFVLRSHDGDKYYMIATDLKVSKQGWGQNQQYGSRKIEVWESTDMVNWKRTNSGNTGITINLPNAGMTWAPEATWDDSLGAYVVFFSSRLFTDDNRGTAVTNPKTHEQGYNEILYCITRDFKNFTKPVEWQNTGYSRIDSDVIKIGDYYYRLTKNEERGAAGPYLRHGKVVFLERSKVLTAPTTEASPTNDPNTGWQLIDDYILPFEGPESIYLNKDDVNQNAKKDAMVIMSDSGGYQPFMTSASQMLGASWNSRISSTKGWMDKKPAGPGVTGRVNNTGMPIPTRHGAFVSVPKQVLANMHRWTTAKPTTVDPVATTLKLTHRGTRFTATVTAADSGEVAGNVTISLNDKTARRNHMTSTAKTYQARLDHGVATVTIPASELPVGTTVTAAYAGYGDGLAGDTVLSPSTNSLLISEEVNPSTPVSPAKPENPSTPSSGKTPGNHMGGVANASASKRAGLAHTGAVVGVVALATILLMGLGLGLVVLRRLHRSKMMR